MSGNIPCTVAILTKNSARTLGRALEGVRHFSDIVVCDGGSTDATLDIARRYGARIISQDEQFLDKNGHIKDFAGVRNQTLAAAREEWFFFLDADEYVLPHFVEVLRSATSGSACAYWVPRKYMLDGVLIERSMGYPNRQVRLFNRACVSAFRKSVHEKIVVHASSLMHEFQEAIIVPIESSIADQRSKSARYIALELGRLAPLTLAARGRVVVSALKTTLVYLLRLVCLMLPPYRGARMPLRREFEAIRYQIMLARSACTA